MNIQEFHEWIGDGNRFDVTIYNISNALGNGGTSGDLGPFIAKHTDCLFLIYHAGRNYDPITESYEYPYIKTISTYQDGIYLLTEKIYKYVDDTQSIPIKQEIFIKKLGKNTKPIQYPEVVQSSNSESITAKSE